MTFLPVCRLRRSLENHRVVVRLTRNSSDVGRTKFPNHFRRHRPSSPTSVRFLRPSSTLFSAHLAPLVRISPLECFSSGIRATEPSAFIIISNAKTKIEFSVVCSQDNRTVGRAERHYDAIILRYVPIFCPPRCYGLRIFWRGALIILWLRGPRERDAYIIRDADRMANRFHANAILARLLQRMITNDPSKIFQVSLSRCHLREESQFFARYLLRRILRYDYRGVSWRIWRLPWDSVEDLEYSGIFLYLEESEFMKFYFSGFD